MCGIAGIFGAGDHAVLDAMTRRLDHRGPDGRGICRLGAASLGATRLSLVDFEHGAQPAVGAGGRLALAYNGEIYNHETLRRGLLGRGARFEGRCDTEVVLRAFELDGTDCLETFEGMYAFAVSDGERLWLARDAFGIKPLCYALLDDGRRLIFASELKALLEDPALPRRLDRSALLDQGVFGYPLAGKTLFAAVRELPPSSVLTVEQAPDGRLRLELGRHSQVAPLDLPRDDDRVAAEILGRLRQSVDEQRIADHPVGAYLSGGLDSSLLVVSMVEAARAPVHTFATADSPDHPDLEMARALARHLGTHHHERIVTTRELLDALPAAVVELESTGLPSIAEMAAPELHRHVKAALCGDGADELFAGYIMHARPERWLGLFAQRYNRMIRGGEILETDTADALAALRRLSEGGDGDLRDRFHRFYLGAQLTSAHLRRWDLGTMAHGLELRVPYLCRPLRDLALALSWNQRLRGRFTKWALRTAALRALPEPLASAIVERPKLAAPSAYQRRSRVLERYLRRLLPTGWQTEPHPLRPFFGTALERCLLDLFVLFFVGHGGRMPEGFRLENLYLRHRADLAAALETAAGSGDGSPRATMGP